MRERVHYLIRSPPLSLAPSLPPSLPPSLSPFTLPPQRSNLANRENDDL
jgi:hypothetical protein